MIMPVLLSYAETIQGIAAEEVGAEPGMTDDLAKWMDGYADVLGAQLYQLVYGPVTRRNPDRQRRRA